MLFSAVPSDVLRKRARLLPGPIATLGLMSLVGVVAVFAGSAALDPGPGRAVPGMASLLFAVATAVALAGMRSGFEYTRLGACNLVTLARAAMVAVLATVAMVPEVLHAAPLTVLALAATALALDGADGALARRAGLVSPFGARFDMEVDAAFAAVLALILWRSGGVEGALPLACLLLLGFARYGFVAAAWALPWLNAPLPERLSRKAVCVIQIATLCGLLPVARHGVPPAVLLVAAGLLIWSFGRDILWLARRR